VSPGGGGGRFGIPVEAVEVWMGWGSWVTWGIDAWVWASDKQSDLVTALAQEWNDTREETHQDPNLLVLGDDHQYTIIK
jgi:hypothetical protein